MIEFLPLPDAVALSAAIWGWMDQITMKMVLQTVVAILGLLSVHFMTSHPPHLMASCLFGLASQPIWLYTTWTEANYGFFSLACYYTWRYLHVVFKWVRGRFLKVR